MMLQVRRLAAVIAVSTLATVGACGSDSSDSQPQSSRTTPTDKSGLSIEDPQLVRNSDGTATLIGTLTNHSDTDTSLNNAYIGKPDDYDERVPMLYRVERSLAAGSSIEIGKKSDPLRLRTPKAANAQSPVTLAFDYYCDSDSAVDLGELTFTAPLVDRTDQHADVVGEQPTDEIDVEDGAVVIVPGQREAYLRGNYVSTIEDAAYEIPTATNQDGKKIKLRHNTATGGPYGIFVKPGRTDVGPGSVSVSDPMERGDVDYFRAADVTVGDTLELIIQFQSGPVIAKLKVVNA